VKVTLKTEILALSFTLRKKGTKAVSHWGGTLLYLKGAYWYLHGMHLQICTMKVPICTL